MPDVTKQPKPPDDLSPEERYRYARQIRLPGIGEQGQRRLAGGSVLTIGAGGLGAPALQYLAGAGVGRIGIVDFDRVQAPDLHRQPLYDHDALGRLKAEAAAERLRSINPLIVVEPYPVVLSPENAVTLCSRYDLILDASDNFATRYLINDAAVRAGRPVVYGAVHRYEGQYAVFNFGDGPTYRCLYPVPPDEAQAPSCSEAGVLGVAAGIVGLQMAWQAMALLLGRTPSGAGKLTLFDLQCGRTTSMTVKRRQDTLNRSARGPLGESDRYAGAATVCRAPDDLELGATELVALMQRDGIHLIDVREPGEDAFGPPIEAESIPASMIPARADLVPNDRPVVLCCDSGGRSRSAAARLRSLGGFDHVRSLRGGLLALDAERDSQVTHGGS